MKSGVRNFDPNTGHMIGINKKCSNSTGSQTTANGQVTITAIFYDPQFTCKKCFKNVPTNYHPIYWCEFD